jgi:hypothetical protein
MPEAIFLYFWRVKEQHVFNDRLSFRLLAGSFFQFNAVCYFWSSGFCGCLASLEGCLSLAKNTTQK